MTTPALVPGPREPEPSPVARALDPAGLDRVGDPGVGAVHWVRPLAPDEAEAFARWAAGPVIRVQVVTQAERAQEAGLRVAAAAPEGPARARLAADLAWLAPSMAHRLGSGVVRVALRTIDHDACHRYHCDWLSFRALVTYTGPGTEWTTESPMQGEPDWAPRSVQQASAGDVLVLAGRERGGDCPTEPTVWHRSPPIQGTGLKRLVLTVDDLV